MNNALPTIGAAMTIDKLAIYRDWLIDGRRDLEIQDAVSPQVLDGDWRGEARRGRALLEGFEGRLGIHGPFLGLTLTAHDPMVREVVIARLRRGLEFAGELGATHMVVHSPFLSFGSPFLPFVPASRRTHEIGLAHAVIEPLLPLAEQLHCMLVIENIVDANPAPLLDLIHSFDSPLVQASLDTGHATITQRTGGPPPDQWVREAGPLLAHVHVQDSDGHLDRHWAPGDGAINWYALFEAIGELAHQPRMVLELRDHSHIPRGAAYLAERGFVR
ncbi:MAG: sugar phosphate isomerase/epimerase [Oscillochloris sp.]|nr:sugar phosphate isomerase/epimerase [Oscillochloris sp.]